MGSNDFRSIIQASVSLFNSFEHVYLFGSALFDNGLCNDIDLLLVYTEYSEKIGEDIKMIMTTLEKESGIPIDLTVLSRAEEQEVSFLKRLNGHYAIIK